MFFSYSGAIPSSALPCFDEVARCQSNRRIHYFRREGDSLLYLSELRFKQGAAMNLKMSVYSDSAPPLSTGNNADGMYIGIDYRGEEVLSDISLVPETDWFLVSKIDTEEIFDDLNFKMVVNWQWRQYLEILCCLWDLP
ncbi:MAG: hypothetical protein IPJ75_11215 [Ignavibacteriales bacterium]|nr:hypothetical protein [Ignavibacteriales bacterium]